MVGDLPGARNCWITCDFVLPGAGDGSTCPCSGSEGVLGQWLGMFVLAPLTRGFAWKQDASNFQSCSYRCWRGGVQHGATSGAFMGGGSQIIVSPCSRLRFLPMKWG